MPPRPGRPDLAHDHAGGGGGVLALARPGAHPRAGGRRALRGRRHRASSARSTTSISTRWRTRRRSGRSCHSPPERSHTLTRRMVPHSSTRCGGYRWRQARAADREACSSPSSSRPRAGRRRATALQPVLASPRSGRDRRRPSTCWPRRPGHEHRDRGEALAARRPGPGRGRAVVPSHGGGRAAVLDALRAGPLARASAPTAPSCARPARISSRSASTPSERSQMALTGQGVLIIWHTMTPRGTSG
jgi:hypothetical protein